MTNGKMFEVDELQLYFGDPYIINEHISIIQPTINDIILYGESNYFSVIHSIVAIPSDMKSILWDQMNLDWTELDDYELFMIMAQTLTPDKTSILFGDLDFSKLKPFKNKQNDEIVLADVDTGVIIDKMIYLRIVTYLRKLHNMKKPKVENAVNKITKKVLLDEDRDKVRLSKDKPFQSYLLPMISSVKVKQGYTKDYVRHMGLSEFFTEVTRLQIIDQADHLLNGVYCGMADLSKVNKKNFDWMRPIEEE
jgi:hypothetical protein